ncbi:MAG TPA: type I-E CRISPR-associated protein Cse1/CasA [Acidobacteriaceae bacterium]|nr:type I-E CRISPR-associated protein Cse1/CasA [Acidobacteriaceae bacterium]
MNLLQDDWIMIRRRSGSTERIAPVRLTAGGEDPAAEIEAPRADFRGALYQFLIGLLQTARAPRDLRAWCKWWDEPPGEEELYEAFAPFVQAFEFDHAGPAFMQDFDLPAAEPVGIAALLIDAPGDKTITDNKDHFVHRDGVQKVCRSCAATALFTLQVNAPTGGAGHRVSVRGGGPLTTLLVPEDSEASLWRKVWLNVLPADALGYSGVESVVDVLPWMGRTRTSETGGVGDTTPETVHRLQVYWSMPRRVRLDFAGEEAGVCDLCGQPADKLVRRYRTKNYGVKYTGAWLHPLSPYNYDPKGEKPPLAVKGKQGGIGYRHWLGLTLGNRDQMPDAALVVKHFMRQQDKFPDAARHTRLWCFGYDLDNMKARCWYDSTLPVYGFANDRQRERFAEATGKLLDVAKEAASALHKCVKQAWFKRPGDAGNEPAVPQSFWQRSETEFYRTLRKLASADLMPDEVLISAYGAWLLVAERTAVELFDEWVLAAPVEEMNMARVVEARTTLLRLLRKSGAAKQLWRVVKEFEEVKA